VIVLDAYAVLAYLRDERAAEEVGKLLSGPTMLAAVNAAEVVDQLVRVYAQDPDKVHADLVMLAHTGMACGAAAGTPLPPRADGDQSR
jgi:PIN domain nuclease of toxin-antitoxin system